MAAPAVVGEVAPGQPVLPMVRRPHQALVGLLVALRWNPAAPRQRAEPGVPFPQQGPPARQRTLDAEPDVRGEGHRKMVLAAAGDRLVIALVGTGAPRPLHPVAEHRLA